MHVNAMAIKKIMASAAEDNVAACFVNAQDAKRLKQHLEDLGHHQSQSKCTTALHFFCTVLSTTQLNKEDQRQLT